MNDQLTHHLRNGTITPAEHQALQLHQRGLSQRTAATILGITRSAYRQRISNATRKLAELPPPSLKEPYAP